MSELDTDEELATVREGRRKVAVRHDPPEASEEEERYEVLETLGRGGMGVVVAARDGQLGRVVAIKRMLEGDHGDRAALRRFWIEAQVSAQLEHPHIVPVYEIESADGAPSFTMRMLDKRTLKTFVKECREPERHELESHMLPARLRHFLRIAEAVGYAHSRGVIHRDLKPQNIVLGHHGELYVVDWGVAKVVDDPEATIELSGPASSPSGRGATQHGDVIGTPTYMPPEQANGDLEEHGPASDQFALGMILQELVTLRQPREGPAMDQVLAASEGERLPIDAAVAPELRAIVARATARDPDERYDDVDALVTDVEHFLRGAPVSVHREGLARRVWRRLSRRPAMALGVGLGLIVLALLGAVTGLGATVVVQARAQRESARLGELAGAAIRHCERIDSRFARAAELVEGIAMASTTLQEGDRPLDGEIPYGASGQLAETSEPRFTDLHDALGYDYPVSFTRPAFHWPDGADPEAARRHMRVMRPLAPELRAAYLRSLDEEAPAWSPARRDAALERGDVPLWSIYVAFEDGLMLSYPGWIDLRDGYDARERPWYRSVTERTGIHFGEPYADVGSGAIILPCTRALRDASGQFLGAAGADFKLDDLAVLMRIDEPGWQRSSLVDGQGREIVNTDQWGLRLESLRDHDDTTETDVPLDPSLWQRIREDETGWWRGGDELVIFDPLEEPGWTFVVHFDAEAALADRRD